MFCCGSLIAVFPKCCPIQAEPKRLYRSVCLHQVQTGPWPHELKDSLASAITSAAAAGSHSVQAMSCKNQNFRNFETYMTQRLLTSWPTPGPLKAKMEAMCILLARLGLRNPSEKSVQHIVGLFLMVVEGHTAIEFDGALKLNYVVEFKRMLKQTCGARAKSTLSYIPEYPSDAASLALSHPELHKNAYEGETVVSLVVDFADLGRLVESVPLRASKVGSARAAPRYLSRGELPVHISPPIPKFQC